MPKTTNSYSPDNGELAVAISAANVTAIAAFSTAETVTIEGAVRSFRRTNTPSRTRRETKVVGDTEPIVNLSTQVDSSEEWTLVLVDDYYKGSAGEWGTDGLSAVEIFKEFFENRETLGGLSATPAGSDAANIEVTLTGPVEVVSITTPDIDADTDEVAIVTIVLSAAGNTTAAHG